MPRIREIRCPHVSAIPVGLSVGMTMIGVLIVWAMIDEGRGLSSLTPAPTVIYLAITLFFWGLTALQIHSLRNKPAHRMQRLKRLLSTPAGRNRFPHRLLERRYRRFIRLTQKWGLRRAMRNVENVVVVANRLGPVNPFGWGREQTRHLPRSAADGFEPIPLHGDNARLADLASLESHAAPAGSTHAAAGHHQTAHIPTAFPPLQGLGRVFTAPVRSTKYLIVVGITLLLTLPAMRSSPIFSILMLVIVGLICYAFYRIENREYHWWLIPGGLVYRRGGLLTAGTHVRRIPACEAILFFDYESPLRYAWVAHRRRLYRIACDRTRFPYLLAAWLNRARTPTEDELQALFTGEA